MLTIRHDETHPSLPPAARGGPARDIFQLPRLAAESTATPGLFRRLASECADAGLWLAARVLLVSLLSSLPLLAISADAFGVESQRTTALEVMLPLIGVLAVIVTVAPHPVDVMIGRGLVAGMVACVPYDAFRLFTVYVLGWMGDFIPRMGARIVGGSNNAASAVLGYVWRYLGDAGGLGVAFYLIAFAVCMHKPAVRDRKIVTSAICFAVFPVWTGLIATVAFASRGEELLFQLNPATVTVTLIGHLIFGFVLGLCFVQARRLVAQPLQPRLAVTAAATCTGES